MTWSAAIARETCRTLASDPENETTRRALLFNSRLREDNISIPIPYIESVEFESEGLHPLYLTVRDEADGSYYIDISNRSEIAIIDTARNSMLLNSDGIRFSTTGCVYDVSVSIQDMYEQITDLAGVQCAAIRRERRMKDLEFMQVLNLVDQCGQPVNRDIRRYPQLLVGDTACTDVQVDEETGRWEFDCTFPGLESGLLRCQRSIKNNIIDFLTGDPFEGSCLGIPTVITTLGLSGQDLFDPAVMMGEFSNQGLDETQQAEADDAVAAFSQLWGVMQQFFTLGGGSADGNTDISDLERYTDLYNTHRSFENDICQSLHAGDIPLSLSLLAGATYIPSITTLNWAPERPPSYNITIQDPSQIACCPNSQVAERQDDTCAYPSSALIPGTGCICGRAASGEGVAFEWMECRNLEMGEEGCEGNGDCGEGEVCLIGSCCDGGVCVDALACSQNGTGLVKFPGAVVG